ncbi:hypothetical protein M3196_00820 [Fictibacillus nanhaiensis]|uniref:hypothetical protein n=1 Tax=Fictibacillus nanhaiensis TaxID=742169 RepID=UPI00203FABF8|nr:hypothetical protein [Fictibacillus nanhaiensis]MCM3730209.1 hypothetical protein [Fictibacillus nanhaiensis]
MKEKSVRMFPYGGYDPFSTPSSKVFSQSQNIPDRPPYAPAAPASMQQQYTQGFAQPFMPMMPPMMPPGLVPHPMMQGMPFNQQQGGQNSAMFPNTQGSGLNFSKVMGGANQFMGLAQQMGNIFSLFK